MTKIHCDEPKFNIIDVIADADETVITLEYTDDIEDRFETFAGPINARVEIIAVMNVSFNHEDIDDDGRVEIDATSADIVSLQIKSRIIEEVEEEIYEDIQADIKDEMIRSLLSQKFAVRIDRDE